MKMTVLTVFMAVLILSSFPILQNGFSTSSTHDDFSSPIDFRTITNQGEADDVPDATVSLDKSIYVPGNTATVTVNDPNANVTSDAIDFATAVVSGSSITLTESAASSGIFSGTFTVGNDAPSVDYTPDPKNSVRARVDVSGFSGELTFGDSIVSDDEANNTCFYPVTGALNITGTLTVQPEVFLSYANANFTGVAAGSDALDLGMYYKAPGEQFERITLPFTSGDTEFIDGSAKTIKSKNSGDTGSVSGAGILDPGGFAGRTEYQGEYVLGIDSGCAGGGGGGLVRPGLVVNALAGIGTLGGGGSSSTSAPSVSIGDLVARNSIVVPTEVEQMVLNHDSTEPIQPMPLDTYSDYEDFDFPLIINDMGFITGGYTNTIQTQTVKTNTPITLTFTVYEAETIQHFSLYTNLRDSKTQIHQSDTQILYNDGKDLKIVDPNGFFTDASLTIQEEEDLPKKQVTVELVFAKPMETSDIAIRSWDPNLFSKDMFLLDALKVESDEPEFSPVPDNPEPDLEPLMTQTIPIWVKNNAAWWSDSMIDDEDFVAGIQYLINNDIIIVDDTESKNQISEIPDWVKNNARWWSDSLINDDDFTTSMEWLIENGVINLK